MKEYRSNVLREQGKMRDFRYVITDPDGLHARPAGILVRKCAAYRSIVCLTRGEKTVDAKRIFGIMGLGVKRGEEIMMTIAGEDEEAAAWELESFFRENL